MGKEQIQPIPEEVKAANTAAVLAKNKRGVIAASKRNKDAAAGIVPVEIVAVDKDDNPVL